jgi:hypothetical protein
LVNPPPPDPNGLEPLRVGESYLIRMPYQNLQVRARYHGELPTIGDLPTRGNRLGDMYLVGQTPWLWIVAPGAARPTWVDP